MLKAARNDVQMAADALQTNAGIQSRIEAAVHAMVRVFQEEDYEAVILVEADNAFNRLNKKWLSTSYLGLVFHYISFCIMTTK